MRTILITLFIASLLVTGAAFADGAMSGNAGKYTVILDTQPSPVKIGDNTLVITVKDGDKPLSGADVNVHLDMATMSMPADVTAIPEKTAGDYQAKANLGMAGDWKVTVNVQQMAGMTMDGDGKADFTLTVGSESATATAPSPTPVSSPAAGNIPWLWIGIGVLVLVGIIIALRPRGKKA
ncbi:MAG: FixH family protein [Armatimonadota bacterium]